jgi:hypothetical protein
MNALELFRTGRGLTFEALKDLAGYPARMTVFRHCKAAKIPGDAALVYHRKLGIPLQELRPDLYPNQEEAPDAAELLDEPQDENRPQRPPSQEPAAARA